MKMEMHKEHRNKKGRITRLAALSLTLGLCLTGCGKDSSPEQKNSGGSNTSVVTPDAPKPEASVKNLSENVKALEIPDTRLSEQNADALSKSGVILLQKAAAMEKDKNQNLLISPFSIQMALGMTAAGSDDGSTTQKEMMEVLLPGVNGTSATLNQEMATFAKRMETEKEVSWNVANSIWVNAEKNVHLSEGYISDATNYYDSTLFSASFDDSVKDAINAWIRKETRDRIPSMLDQLNPDTALILVNALAFDGEWANPYEEKDVREDQIFTNADKSLSHVTMLKSEENRTIKLGGGIGFIRPYKGYKYSFVGLLPPEGMSTEDYLSKISEDKNDFAKAYRNCDYARTAYVTMPEFKTEFGITLDDVLQSLGMKEAYSDNASFRKMLTEESNPVKIDTVIHKAMIEVDRKGTKAAAATVVAVTEATAIADPESPLTITLDRPFVYAIVDNESGVPIFLGTENSMN